MRDRRARVKLGCLGNIRRYPNRLTTVSSATVKIAVTDYPDIQQCLAHTALTLGEMRMLAKMCVSSHSQSALTVSSDMVDRGVPICRLREMMPAALRPLSEVWLCRSIENQKTAFGRNPQSGYHSQPERRFQNALRLCHAVSPKWSTE